MANNSNPNVPEPTGNVNGWKIIAIKISPYLFLAPCNWESDQQIAEHRTFDWLRERDTLCPIGSLVMAAPPDVPLVVRFGSFEADIRSGELRCNGAMVRLQQKPFQLLKVLLEHPGRLLTREELRQRLWEADTFVDFDSSLNTAITKLREALGDSAEEHRYIETLARRGYRFVAAVEPPPRLWPAVVQSPLPSVMAKQIRNTRPALRRIRMAALACLVGLVILLTYVAYSRSHRGSSEVRVMLAVLPFDNLGPDVSEEYLSDGLTEETITQLGELSPDRLGVIARTSAMRFKKTRQGIDQIGRELHVNYIVEGSIRKEATRVRVTAQLIRVHDQTHLWAASYDRNIGGVLDLQGEIAQAIASAIEIKLSPEQQKRLASSHPVSLEAHDAYLMGRYFWNRRTSGTLKKAISHFEQAIQIDPNYALAYAGLADCYAVLPNYSNVSDREAELKTEAAATRALQLDPNLGEVYATLAIVSEARWKWAEAETRFKQAIDLTPNDATIHQWYADYLEQVGRLDEAAVELKKAQELDPLSVIINAFVANQLYLERRYDDAIAQSRKVLEMEPTRTDFRNQLGLVFVTKGLLNDAIAEFRTIRDLSPNDPKPIGLLGAVYAISGKPQEARKALQELDALAKRGQPRSEFYSALVHIGLGEKDQGFQLLNRAVDEHIGEIAWLKSSPAFDSLRADPRYDLLLKRMNFPTD
jgi:TolB-like protein/DNA-binding winged helix-turn-helix (wHTH) protein/Flp pilus assembly protein TadD